MLTWLLLCSLFGSIALAQEFSLIGEAYEAGNPCETGILTMERYIGGPPSKENYWNGTLDFDRYPNLPEARVTLQLTAPATVTLDEEDGRILTSDDAFHLSFFKKDNGKFRPEFHVQGRPRGDFPNLKALHLNNADVCKNISEWQPSILGSGDNVGTLGGTNIPGSNAISIDNKCGQRRIHHQGLITNGFPSREGDWPWHAALYHQNRKSSTYVCGGTLISSKAVLTAAHCLDEYGKIIIPERLLVKLGQHNRLLSGGNTQEFGVFKVIVHEEYNSNNARNDIALLKLSTEVAFNNYIQPACLWGKDKTKLDEVIDHKGTVVGWGLDQEEELAVILTQATMPVVSITTCLESDSQYFATYLSDYNYCAGYRNGTSVCNGDSGGGMFFENNNLFHIRGLVSIGASQRNKNVCNPKKFVIFTDVAKFLDWIETNML